MYVDLESAGSEKKRERNKEGDRLPRKMQLSYHFQILLQNVTGINHIILI